MPRALGVSISPLRLKTVLTVPSGGGGGESGGHSPGGGLPKTLRRCSEHIPAAFWQALREARLISDRCTIASLR